MGVLKVKVKATSLRNAKPPTAAIVASIPSGISFESDAVSTPTHPGVDASTVPRGTYPLSIDSIAKAKLIPCLEPCKWIAASNSNTNFIMGVSSIRQATQSYGDNSAAKTRQGDNMEKQCKDVYAFNLMFVKLYSAGADISVPRRCPKLHLNLIVDTGKELGFDSDITRTLCKDIIRVAKVNGYNISGRKERDSNELLISMLQKLYITSLNSNRNYLASSSALSILSTPNNLIGDINMLLAKLPNEGKEIQTSIVTATYDTAHIMSGRSAVSILEKRLQTTPRGR